MSIRSIGVLIALFVGMVSEFSGNLLFANPSSGSFKLGDQVLNVDKTSIKLQVDTFDSIQKKLGKAQFLPKKEHGDKKICYHNQSQIIEFSSGALGGWSSLESFTIISKQLSTKFTYKHAALCTLIPDSFNIQTLSNIKIGSSNAKTMLSKVYTPKTFICAAGFCALSISETVTENKKNYDLFASIELFLENGITWGYSSTLSWSN